MITTALHVALILGIMGAFIGLVLAISERVFHVEVDARLEKILKALPNINCGACGFPGCAGMAEGILNGEADVQNCKPANELTYAKVKAILNGEDEESTLVNTEKAKA